MSGRWLGWVGILEAAVLWLNATLCAPGDVTSAIDVPPSIDVTSSVTVYGWLSQFGCMV